MVHVSANLLNYAYHYVCHLDLQCLARISRPTTKSAAGAVRATIGVPMVRPYATEHAHDFAASTGEGAAVAACRV